MTWPFPDLLLSNKASNIPRAQVMPPPAKSANRFMGAVGFSPFRPSFESKPLRATKLMSWPAFVAWLPV